MSAAADPTRAVPEPRRGAGFSLIEVLIALSILLVGGVSILAVFALAASHGIERRVEAGLPAFVGSVASVFISRWDGAVAAAIPPELQLQLGLAGAALDQDIQDRLPRAPRIDRVVQAPGAHCAG